MKALLQLLAVIAPVICSAVDHAVTLNNNAFTPSSLNIAVGDKVIWTFRDGGHTVTSGANCTADGKFNSGPKLANQTFEHTFTSSGTFPYYSQNHCDNQVFGVINVGTTGIESEDRMGGAANLSNYPNPFVNSTIFRFHAEQKCQGTLDIITTDGKLISSERISVQPGDNALQLTLNIPAGIYLVRLQLEGTLPETRIIVKQEN